jgi:hypothetical protein
MPLTDLWKGNLGVTAGWCSATRFRPTYGASLEANSQRVCIWHTTHVFSCIAAGHWKINVSIHTGFNPSHTSCLEFDAGRWTWCFVSFRSLRAMINPGLTILVAGTSGGYLHWSQTPALNVALLVRPQEWRNKDINKQVFPTNCIPIPCISLNLLFWFGKTPQAVDINVNLRPGHARDRVLGWRVAMPVVAAICRYTLICSPGAALACGNGGRERCTNNLRTRTPNLHIFCFVVLSRHSVLFPTTASFSNLFFSRRAL